MLFVSNKFNTHKMQKKICTTLHVVHIFNLYLIKYMTLYIYQNIMSMKVKNFYFSFSFYLPYNFVNLPILSASSDVICPSSARHVQFRSFRVLGLFILASAPSSR